MYLHKNRVFIQISSINTNVSTQESSMYANVFVKYCVTIQISYI